MSRKKGLSLEEKRQKVQQIFLETEDVFVLKEVEKIASTEKGVVLQSVKDVLDSLVSDNLVSSDKVGIVNVFWQFPSKSSMIRQTRLSKIEQELKKTRDSIEAAQKRQTTASQGREDTPERRERLARLAELRQQKESLNKQLSSFAASDPKVIEAMKKDTTIAKDAANRWTDNIFTLREWCHNTFGVDPEEFEKGFDLPSNLDYLS